jgi:hypothetical protein
LTSTLQPDNFTATPKSDVQDPGAGLIKHTQLPIFYVVGFCLGNQAKTDYNITDTLNYTTLEYHAMLAPSIK